MGCNQERALVSSARQPTVGHVALLRNKAGRESPFCGENVRMPVLG